MPSNIRSRVLCVDDDLDACEMLSELMNSYQIDAICAQSTAEAWLKIKAERFDLFMLDAWLPGVDGFEFCRQIRKCDSRTPILFYSGAAYDADRQKALAAGANAYVTKPDVEVLIETMVDLIDKAKVADVAARWVTKRRRPTENWFSAQLFSVKAATD
jgi:DNA-binding response OmpR family regulator